jgi:hypothetical protein
VATLAATFVFSPIASSTLAQPNRPGPGLVIPNVSGAVLQGGQTVGQLTDGTLTITRLQERGGQLVADGTLSGTAIPGPGNLLGNLLCAVAGLLDQGPSGGLGGVLNELLSIINRLLGGLG